MIKETEEKVREAIERIRTLKKRQKAIQNFHKPLAIRILLEIQQNNQDPELFLDVFLQEFRKQDSFDNESKI